MTLRFPGFLLVGTSVLLASTTTAFGQFQDNTSQIPQGSPFNSSNSENVDFADVDLDGDWDAAFADGGDGGSDRNRLWINMGGQQGGSTGFFEDRTQSHFPAVSDQSRDIEFVDFDGDGDSDLYISNTSTITDQTNRWWTNLGGDQGGSAGFYVDETAQRWVGLGGPGSSIAPSLVLGSGGFKDWSCDSDFGDLDNDGDLDLVHSSYGPTFSGNTPTRIFLNDGSGHFEEFNPSGFQLTGSVIVNGDPGLWCEGTQQAETMDWTGTFCDIASSALDIELGDIDQDFDLDILHGARQQDPRMFANRLEPSNLTPGGGLLFRDVTHRVFPSGYVTGSGHYEQEMGDLDGDGDLDIFGLNWHAGFNFNDVTLTNNGDGTFGNVTVLVDSQSDDNEGDFLDYDGDGDLDLYVCNFSGQDKLYRNGNDGGSDFSFVNVTAAELPSLTLTGLDADAADLDGDGDYDLMVANNFNARNYFVKNLNDAPDVSAPYIPNLEQAPDRACGSVPTVVRAHVYDNAPYYVTWYNETLVEVSVDGGALQVYPATSSGGQIFRAEIPGELSGNVCYTFVSRDEYGNEGLSATRCYTATGSCGGTAYCAPANANSVSAGGAVLSHVAGSPGGVMTFQLTDVPAGQFGILYYGPGQADVPYDCGRRCVAGLVVRSAPYAIPATSFQAVLDTSPPPALPDPFNIQFWFRDPANLANCGAASNLSTALAF